ncbi:GNAT family N-acetyltransferase [Bacillus sp. es.036]|uniref:GNAT family N-acetyltransferase n=1 Tax=Bacillus sp. es.036 TaxID=1761764 RepID=UPI000BF857E5|nr:GNAT family N-acetyltransferase [Bacillus sp. es.036]PFG14649.1 RimJ/RimL family protein N-acetyltransferase [Bacillus sp. es.036]
MKVTQREYRVESLCYVIRSAELEDAHQLSNVRRQIDAETDFLDREKGEALLDGAMFKQIILKDEEAPTNLFLVAEVNSKIVGYARCEGTQLKRFSHKVTFGVGVLRDYWGYGIGSSLLKNSITWADRNNVKKIALYVSETNTKAVNLYQDHGFEVEGILKRDKRLSNDQYINTIIMGRVQSE